jgi:replicative DNA helicase
MAKKKPSATEGTDIFQRVPPQSLEAERSVIGSMLLVNEVIDDVLQLLRADYFYNDAHREIYSAILQLHENGHRGIDAVTLAEALTKRATLETIGGPHAILNILETVPHAAHAEHYARIVREKWLQRTLIYTCTDILKTSYDSQEDVSDVLKEAERRIFEIAEQQENLSKIDIESILHDTWERIMERANNPDEVTGLTSGFVGLDKMTSGFQKTELVILAARPSMGKTAFVCNCALAMAGKGKTGVLIFSLEQSKLELAERFLCQFAKVDGHKVRQGNLDKFERDQILEASSELGTFPIFIDDVPGRTISQISAFARRMKRQSGIGCVIIDYLQLIEAEEKTMPREQQIATITRRLKFMAKELQIPVIALAQVNRGVEQRDDKKPKLSDLRESGAIEQDADLVIFLHREEVYNPSEENKGLADLIVAKNRSGPIGIAPLTWLKESMRFADRAQLQDYKGF